MSKTPGESVKEIGQGELTKDAVRQVVWEYLENNNLVNFPRPVFNRIPNFKGAAPAAEKLATMDEFKSANLIKINPDKPQENCRYLTIEAEKTLLVPTPRLRTGLFNKIVVPENAGKGLLRICSTTQGIREHSEPIGLEDKVKVDLIVIGCVAVSKQGYRIGKGEGFGDLEYAMMKTMGAIDDNTIVISTVHDSQVIDFPESLLQPHDVMVNYIVTPTEIIKCNCDRSQPKGIIWSLLTPEKMKKVPVLKRLRQKEREAGIDVTLKDDAEFDDTVEDEDDDENYRHNNYRRRPYYRRSGPPYRRTRRRPPPSSENDEREGRANEDEQESGGERNENSGRRPYRRNRRFRRRRGPSEGEGGEFGNERNEDGSGFRRRRGPSEKEGGEFGNERNEYRSGFRRRRGPSEGEGGESGNERNEDGSGDTRDKRSPPRRRRPRPPRRRRTTDDRDGDEREREREPRENGEEGDRPRQRRYRGGPPRARMPTIFIGSIPNSVRVSELKTQIRGMDVNPIRIIWHGARGYAFFQFTKMEEMETALDTLKDVEIKGKKLRVELSTVLNRKRNQSGGEGDADGSQDNKENIPRSNITNSED